MIYKFIDNNGAEILEDWFFGMGGRGAQPSRGNRSKNVLIGAALISILGEISPADMPKTNYSAFI